MASAAKKPPMGPEPTRLRQIALVAYDLEKATHLLTTVLGTEVIYEDPLVAQWGLKNILVPLGGDIIEVISPIFPSSSVPAYRHLSKHGEGGYMIIMQTASAIARRDYLTSHSLAEVIFEHKTEESVCIQYHPKTIKGGVIPELDSHFAKEGSPDGMKEKVAPWHACGPLSGFARYRDAMERHSHLRFLTIILQLAPGDQDVEGAARQWESLFGVERVEVNQVAFTNTFLAFLAGREGERERLKGIAVGVLGKENLDGILGRASVEGLEVHEEDYGGSFEMLGVMWRFILEDRIFRTSRL
ncbi:hypothetical protein N431DRAFT_552700 [Stipitochalara longipes BDJ]|nr:hypothetical protein N431DRAFT_552700 [Stipitochalara longipes BDJ]